MPTKVLRLAVGLSVRVSRKRYPQNSFQTPAKEASFWSFSRRQRFLPWTSLKVNVSWDCLEALTDSCAIVWINLVNSTIGLTPVWVNFENYTAKNLGCQALRFISLNPATDRHLGRLKPFRLGKAVVLGSLCPHISKAIIAALKVSLGSKDLHDVLPWVNFENYTTNLFKLSSGLYL
jgi:hypothetical protein